MTRLAPPAAAVLFSLADAGLTLLGQPPDYWAGDYALADEGNPLVRPFLAWHPLAFVALVGGWWAALTGLYYAPGRWAGRLAAVMVGGHGVAAAGWCWRIFGLVPAVAVLALTVEVARRLWNAKTPA